MVARHADQREAAREVDGVERPERLPALSPAVSSVVHGAAASSIAASARSRARIRPARSSAHGRRSTRQAMMSSPPGSPTVASRSVKPEARRRDQRRAGGRAAGERQPDAALPHLRRDASRATSARTRVRLLGKQRIYFERAAELAASTRARSGTKNTACGLPMLTSPAGPNAAAAAFGRRSDARVSATGRASGISRQSSRGGAHVDAIGPFAEPLAGDEAALGLDRQRRRAGLAAEPVGDAARAVAAGAGERAVVVVDEDVGARLRRARIGQRPSSDRSRDPARDGSRAPRPASAPARPAQVEHEDLVAGAVHARDAPAGQRMAGDKPSASLHGPAARGREPRRPVDRPPAEPRNRFAQVLVFDRRGGGARRGLSRLGRGRRKAAPLLASAAAAPGGRRSCRRSASRDGR